MQKIIWSNIYAKNELIFELIIWSNIYAKNELIIIIT